MKRNHRNVVLVGSGPDAVEIAHYFSQSPDQDIRLLGFIDNDNSLVDILPDANKLCDLNKFPEYLEKNIIDEVFIGLDRKAGKKQANEIINLCQELGVVCHVSPDLVESDTRHTINHKFGNIKLLSTS